MTAPRPTGAPSTPRRPIGALVAALAVAVALASPSAGQVSPPADATVEVTLLDQTTWVDPDGEVVVRVEIDGAPADATVEVTLHERVASRSDFAQTLGRERLRGRLTDPPVVLGTVAELGSTVTARIPLRSEPQDPLAPVRLGIADPGVHPVDVAVYGADRRYLGGLVTHVVRLPSETDRPPLEVVLAQPLEAPISHRADGSIALDQAIRTAWTLVVGALLDAPPLPMVLAPRPEAVAALDGTGARLDRRLLDDLARLVEDRTVPASSFVDLDLDGLTRAGLTPDVALQLGLGADVLGRHLDAAVDGSLWLADATLTDTALATLVERGIERLVVPAEALAAAPDTDPDLDPDPDRPLLEPVRLVVADGTPVAAITTDPLLQQHQHSTDDPRLAAQHLLADLALLWFDDPTRERVVAVELGAADPHPTFVTTLLEGIDTAPLVEAVGARQAFGSAPATLAPHRLRHAVGDTDLDGLRRDLDLTRLSIASFHGVFPPGAGDGDVPSDGFDRLLAVVVSPQLGPTERGAYFTAIADAIDAALARIDLPARAITLPARDGTVPVTLTNDSGRAAVVALRLDSDRLDFPAGQRIEVELAPGTTTVDVVVRARASGAFPLDIEVESPDGRIELASARYTVRSTAVSGVGVAISVAAIVVLAVWWGRTAHRARAARAAPDPGGDLADRV